MARIAAAGVEELGFGFGILVLAGRIVAAGQEVPAGRLVAAALVDHLDTLVEAAVGTGWVGIWTRRLELGVQLVVQPPLLQQQPHR